VPREEVQVLFGHQKQQSPPLGSSLPWAFKCSVTNWSTLWMTANCATSQFWKKKAWWLRGTKKIFQIVLWSLQSVQVQVQLDKQWKKVQQIKCNAKLNEIRSQCAP
jgi:hypothetical protein